MDCRLQLTCQSWNKDSNLLFDYDTHEYYITNLEIKHSGEIIQMDKKIFFKPKQGKMSANGIAEIEANGDLFTIKLNKKQEIAPNVDEKTWIVIKNLYSKDNIGYQLREGDMIKLGKVMFKLREVNLIKSSPVTAVKTTAIKNEVACVVNVKQEQVKKKVPPSCRICLMDDNEPGNPLISPCMCIGSVRFIHLLCLRQWLKSKMTIKSFNLLIVHTFKSFECEICKSAIPDRMKYNNSIISLIDFERPDEDYLILESVSRESRETKYLYLLKLEENKIIRMGRANDSDVRMTDISVSRNHAMIKLIKGKVYLEDNWSKFGTLVQMQNDISFIPNKQISIQFGKLHLIFILGKTCYAWLKCYRNRFLDIEDYNSFFQKQTMDYYQKEIDNFNVLNMDYTSSNSDYESINKKLKPKQNTQEYDEDQEEEEEEVVDSNSEYAVINLRGNEKIKFLDKNNEEGTARNENRKEDNNERSNTSIKQNNITNTEGNALETSYQPFIMKNNHEQSQTMNVTGNTASRPISAIDTLNKNKFKKGNDNVNLEKESNAVVIKSKLFIPKSTKPPSLDKNEQIHRGNTNDFKEDKLLLNKFFSPDKMNTEKEPNGRAKYNTLLFSKQSDSLKHDLDLILGKKSSSPKEIEAEEHIEEEDKTNGIKLNQIENMVDDLFNNLSDLKREDSIKETNRIKRTNSNGDIKSSNDVDDS